MELVC